MDAWGCVGPLDNRRYRVSATWSTELLIFCASPTLLIFISCFLVVVSLLLHVHFSHLSHEIDQHSYPDFLRVSSPAIRLLSFPGSQLMFYALTWTFAYCWSDHWVSGSVLVANLSHPYRKCTLFRPWLCKALTIYICMFRILCKAQCHVIQKITFIQSTCSFTSCWYRIYDVICPKSLMNAKLARRGFTRRGKSTDSSSSTFRICPASWITWHRRISSRLAALSFPKALWSPSARDLSGAARSRKDTKLLWPVRWEHEHGRYVKQWKKMVNTHSSFKIANDHPSILSVISFANWSSIAHALLSSILSSASGRPNLYLTLNREEQLKIATSIFSRWFVAAIVKIPSFRPCYMCNGKLWIRSPSDNTDELLTRPSSSLRKNEQTLSVTMESKSSMTRNVGSVTSSMLEDDSHTDFWSLLENKGFRYWARKNKWTNILLWGERLYIQSRLALLFEENLGRFCLPVPRRT